MKFNSRQLRWILIIAFPIVLLCSLILRSVIANAGIVYPTPETQTAFLRSYTPADTLAPFSLEGSQLSGPGGSSAGRGCAFHQKALEAWLVIAPGKEHELIAAVQQDLRSRLGSEGAHIVTDTGDISQGFRFDYLSGKSEGRVVVDPLVIVDPETVTGPGSRPGEMGVNLRLQITETWYETAKEACRKL